MNANIPHRVLVAGSGVAGLEALLAPESSPRTESNSSCCAPSGC